MASSRRNFILYALRAMPCATSLGFHTTRGARWLHTKPAAWITKKKLLVDKSSFFVGGEGEIWTLAPVIPTYTLSRGASSASWVLLHLAGCRFDPRIILYPKILRLSIRFLHISKKVLTFYPQPPINFILSCVVAYHCMPHVLLYYIGYLKLHFDWLYVILLT